MPGQRFERAGNQPLLAQDIAGRVDDHVPWPGGGQAFEVGAHRAITPDQLDSGHVPAGASTAERRHHVPAGERRVYDSASEEPRFALNAAARQVGRDGSRWAHS